MILILSLLFLTFFLNNSQGAYVQKWASMGKFVKKANHYASCVQGTSNNKKSDAARFATRSEPI